MGAERNTALVITLTLSIPILKFTFIMNESEDKKGGKGTLPTVVLPCIHMWTRTLIPKPKTPSPASVNIGLKIVILIILLNLVNIEHRYLLSSFS